jgi:hypothetical protein
MNLDLCLNKPNFCRRYFSRKHGTLANRERSLLPLKASVDVRHMLPLLRQQPNQLRLADLCGTFCAFEQ